MITTEKDSPALVTLAVVQPEEVVQALAAALLSLLVAEVVGIREDAQKPDQAVQLAHPVLQGGPAQGPLVAAVQGEDCLGGAAPPVLDAVGFVQNDAPPWYLSETNICTNLIILQYSSPHSFIHNDAPLNDLRETNFFYLLACSVMLIHPSFIQNDVPPRCMSEAYSSMGYRNVNPLREMTLAQCKNALKNVWEQLRASLN